MLKARTGVDSRLLTWERIWMGCSKSDLSGCRGPLPPLPLLTKEGSEKRQKLPTRFGEEPINSHSVTCNREYQVQDANRKSSEL